MRRVLHRIPDSRARHYWDEQHFLATRMAKDARPPEPKLSPRDDDGIFWDLVAVYPKGARREATMPPATALDDPVFRVTDRLESTIVK